MKQSGTDCSGLNAKKQMRKRNRKLQKQVVFSDPNVQITVTHCGPRKLLCGPKLARGPAVGLPWCDV